MAIVIDLPSWVGEIVAGAGPFPTDEARMRLAIDLARENVLRGTGGPSGAAIFESGTGRLVAAGVNRVVPANNSVLHAEIVAIMRAEASLGSWTLNLPPRPPHELFASCDPCAMCLGAALWSGVRRIACAARREDAARLGFDEGPVFDGSYRYVEARGIRILRGLLHEEGRAVLEEYRRRRGAIYNA